MQEEGWRLFNFQSILQWLNENLFLLIVVIPLLLFSLSFHEFCHGLIAFRQGDPTAQRSGRLKLNPLVHLDPFGSLMLFLSMINGIGFGWARPVPINPGYFKNPLKGMMFVALAGPGSNLLLALIFGVLLRAVGLPALQADNVFAYILFVGLRINLGLALFNLLPVPPLDGSRVVLYFLRGEALKFWLNMERYGFIILLLAFLFFNQYLNYIIGVPYMFLLRLITGF